MKITTRIRLFLLIAIIAVCPTLPIGAATPIRVDTRDLQILVDPTNCRWSAEVKGTPMQLNDVRFLPNDDSLG